MYAKVALSFMCIYAPIYACTHITNTHEYTGAKSRSIRRCRGEPAGGRPGTYTVVYEVRLRWQQHKLNAQQCQHLIVSTFDPCCVCVHEVFWQRKRHYQDMYHYIQCTITFRTLILAQNQIFHSLNYFCVHYVRRKPLYMQNVILSQFCLCL
jgi:hypothetical protein